MPSISGHLTKAGSAPEPPFHLYLRLLLGRFSAIVISATALMFSVSSLLFTCPNHYNILLLMTIAIGSTFASSKISSCIQCSRRLVPILHCTRLNKVVVIHFSYFADIKQCLSNHCLVGLYQGCLTLTHGHTFMERYSKMLVK